MLNLFFEEESTSGSEDEEHASEHDDEDINSELPLVEDTEDDTEGIFSDDEFPDTASVRYQLRCLYSFKITDREDNFYQTIIYNRVYHFSKGFVISLHNRRSRSRKRSI